MYKDAIKSAEYIQKDVANYMSELEDILQCKMSVEFRVALNNHQIHDMEIFVYCRKQKELLQTIDIEELRSIRYVTYADTNGYVQGGVFLRLEFM